MWIPGDHLGADLIRVWRNDRHRQLNQVLQHHHANNAGNDGVMVMLLRNICCVCSNICLEYLDNVVIFGLIRTPRPGCVCSNILNICVDHLAQVVPVVVEEQVENAVQRLLV